MSFLLITIYTWFKDARIRAMIAFSPLVNARRALSTRRRTTIDVECISGLQVFAVCWFIYSCAYRYSICYLSKFNRMGKWLLSYNVYFAENVSFAVDNANELFYQPLNNASIAIDILFVISGFVTSRYLLQSLKSIDTVQFVQVIRHYLGGYFRSVTISHF
jgi:hypothetical protein